MNLYLIHLIKTAFFMALIIHPFLFGQPYDDSNAEEIETDEYYDSETPQEQSAPPPTSYSEAEASSDQKEQESESLFNSILNQQNQIPYNTGNSWEPPKANAESINQKVKIGLDEYSSLRKQVAQIDKQSSLIRGPMVILGSSEYSGNTVYGSLNLKLNIHATLRAKGVWKTVPLVGSDVILVSATANGKAIPVTTQNSYHVWMTNTDGEVALEIDILVPSHGPRGSIEYDFTSVRTPSTTFSCVFPVSGLEPKLTAAVQSENIKLPAATRFTATLRPTTRIHLIGFKEIGSGEEQDAKVYAETMNLLSVNEDALEVFSAFYYTILYSGAQKFTIKIPDGFKIVSADGQGAFRYTIESTNEGTLLIGETEFPIHNKFEISLRLRKDINKKGELFTAPLPRCKNVERESGWLGVEVPGKMQLEEKSVRSMLQVDMRQLPTELLQSTVSPVLKAYRYHAPDAQAVLYTACLPEIEPISGSIDNIQLTTKADDDGVSITEMQITLRNRLRHNLELSLPDQAQVLSAMIDEQPLNISQNKTGKILLPLKRSSGNEELKPFTISLTYKKKIPKITSIGFRKLQMPSIDLPVSSLSWDVYLPGFNNYSRLKSNISIQEYAGQVTWKKISQSNQYTDYNYQNSETDFGLNQHMENSVAGAMPVQFKIPLGGKKLTYQRYWLEKNSPLTISFNFIRSSLLIPFLLSLFVFISISVFAFFFIQSRLSRYGFSALILALTVTGLYVQGWIFISASIIIGLFAVGIYKKSYDGMIRKVSEYVSSINLKGLKPIKFSLKMISSAFRYILFGVAAIILLFILISFFNLLLNGPLAG
jgi:hypothetical protein